MKPFVNPPSIYPFDEWRIVEEQYEERHHLRNESVFSLANGYIGMRGNLEEGFQGTLGSSVSGTYLNGFYESGPIRYPEGAYGYARNSQTMLNVADAKRMEVAVAGERFSLFSGRVLRYGRELDMRQGIVTRSIEWESPSGKQVAIRIRRMVCLARKHLAAVHYEVKPLNFSGVISFISLLDGEVANQASEHDPRLGSSFSGQALHTEGLAYDGRTMRASIRQRTRNTGFVLVASMAHELEGELAQPLHCASAGQQMEMRFDVAARLGQPIALTKLITYHTSKDYPEEELERLARSETDSAQRAGFAELLAEQRKLLDDFWHRTDVEIAGDPAMQQGIRFNVFQLLQSAGRDGATNIGAKGLTGEGYEGHYFWDTEIFMLPFFTYTNPQIARPLLEYRYATLDKARERARDLSQKGALYPWRTINGDETSAYYPAGTAQAHINADIAHGLRMYAEATGDERFLLDCGAEIVWETARFWADLGYFNPRRNGMFCIDAVTGPDEYTAVVNNNAYTNLMAQAHLEYACQLAAWMQERHREHYIRLASRLGLTDEERAFWRRAAECMFIPFDEELGITAQDDSFLLKERWDFRNAPQDKYPLLLHYHPLVIYRHQVLKQADVVLALFLQGNRFSLADKMRCYHYYEPLTTHDSSLSPCIHSVVAAEIGLVEQAYDYFRRTARMDLDDVNGNVKDGLHTASMAGSWLSIVNGFARMRDIGGELHFNPIVPAQWQSYRFKLTYRGRLLAIHASGQQATYCLLEGEPISIFHRRTKLLLEAKAPIEVSLTKRLEAVLFDLDGVITDTADLHYKAWARLAEELDLPFDRQINEQLKGIGRMESLNILLGPAQEAHSAEHKKEWAQRKNSYYRTLTGRMTADDALPGVVPLLRELKAQGIKLGLASASENAPFVLRRLGLDGLFDAVVDPSSLKKGKPDPEIFLAAAELLGVHAAHCIGIEDAAAGVAAIRSAGMPAVGVGNPQLLAAADIVVDNASQITVELLRRLLEGKEAFPPLQAEKSIGDR